MSLQGNHSHDSHLADETWLLAAREFVTRRVGHFLTAPSNLAAVDLTEDPDQDRRGWAADEA